MIRSSKDGAVRKLDNDLVLGLNSSSEFKSHISSKMKLPSSENNNGNFKKNLAQREGKNIDRLSIRIISDFTD
jgi:hypothetical protein